MTIGTLEEVNGNVERFTLLANGLSLQECLLFDSLTHRAVGKETSSTI
jgi:hypothetical protein